MSAIKHYLHNQMESPIMSSNCKMNEQQLEQLKLNYAEMMVDGMDMDSLITFAVESIEKHIKDWDEDDVKEEILDHYGEETLNDLLPKPTISELELTAPDYGVGK